MAAGELLAGDRLRTEDGRDVAVLGIREGAGSAHVYTLTVTRDHAFFAGSAGVLVHNASPACFGTSPTTNYRSTFFAANPGLEGTVRVHHAVEQQVLRLYPGVVTPSQIHSLENLRGVPNLISNSVHLSEIRKAWNELYRNHPNPTAQDLLDKATEIDDRYGYQFTPAER